MSNEDRPPGHLLALSSEETRSLVAQAAGEANMELTHATTLSGLFQLLQEKEYAASLVDSGLSPKKAPKSPSHSMPLPRMAVRSSSAPVPPWQASSRRWHE